MWPITLIFATILPGQAPRDDGFTPVFDGKTLRGWRVIGGKADAWAVEKGMLVSLDKGGGWLGTEKPYDDFELRLEFRLSPGSNSGIYLRAPGDASHISRTGMEIQLLDETHPTHAKIQDWQRTGAIYHVAAPKPGHNKAIGEWNTLAIRAEGPLVTIRLNGTEVVSDRLDKHPTLDAEHPGLKRAGGLIGLQSHNGRVEFRELVLKPIPSR